MKLSNKQILSEIEEENSMVTHSSVGMKEMNPECTKVKNMRYYYNWNGRFKNTYRWGIRFLKKNVGRSWNIIYSELCEKIKNDKDILSQYGWENAKKSICQYVDINRNDYYEDFYVDEQGILRTRLKDKPAHHKDKVFVKTGVHYRLKKEAQQYIPYMYNILIRCINCKLVNDLFYHDITLAQKNTINLFLKNNSWRIGCMVDHIRRTERNNKRYWIGWESGIWCLFDTITDGYYITRTKNKRIQIRKEDQDQKNKIRRDLLKEKKDKQKSLLHIIMKKRKEEEHQKNLIKIQAHGMDEKTSFRGEEYHGQKRKKKGMKN